MKILGIDPGSRNAGAAIVEVVAPDLVRLVDAIGVACTGEGSDLRIIARQFAEWILDWKPEIGIIERAQIKPLDGRTTAGVYMRATGALETCVVLCGVRLITVEASCWKSYFGLKGKSKYKDPDEAKQAARLYALEAFTPRPDYLLGEPRYHNRAEAALIALYGARETAGTGG